MADKWYNEGTVRAAFQSVLIDAGILEDTDDIKTFNKSPFRYTDAYESWLSFGAPEDGDENWDDFVAAFDDGGDEEDEDEEDDEDE